MDILFYFDKTPLTILHILGVTFGLGVATCADILLFKALYHEDYFSNEVYKVIDLLSKLVLAALIILWISGLSFLVYYYFYAPEKLANPKIWSKLMVVLVLSINGVGVHHYVLPHLKRCIGRPIFFVLSLPLLRVMFAVGAISVCSWYIPFFYGTVPQLNFSFTFFEFTLFYCSSLIFAILSSQLFLGYLRRKYFNLSSNHIQHSHSKVALK